jgi:hypothetical protein
MFGDCLETGGDEANTHVALLQADDVSRKWVFPQAA